MLVLMASNIQINIDEISEVSVIFISSYEHEPKLGSNWEKIIQIAHIFQSGADVNSVILHIIPISW